MTRLPIGRPRFVALEEALGWHETAIAQYGGSLGVRDVGLLESALAQPGQQFGGEFAHEYPFGMAAAYAFFIAKNHPFVDGNKRVALFCAGSFLRMNGWNLESKGEDAAEAVLGLVEGRIDRDAFAHWLSGHCRERPTMDLRDFFGVIDIDQLHTMLSSVALKPDHTELNQSAEEAAQSIPAVRSLFVASRYFYEQGNARAGADLGNEAMLLVALYRIAEDMGYEW